MRSLLAVVAIALFAGACPPTATQCSVSTDCGPGSICVDAACVADPTGGEGEPGEGEGAAGEGEGTAGEGEGAAGEGEGTAGEGEGSAGEGEGAAAEGEGAADVCGTFDGSTIGVFATANENLDSTTATHFAIDGVDRLERAHIVTGSTPTMKLQVTLTSTAFAPLLYVFDDGNGTCVEETNTASQVTVDFAAQDEADLVVTASDGGTGAYTLKTRPLICGLPTDSLATFNECAPRVASQGCDHNPCSNLNTDGSTSGHLCCVTQSCRNGFATGSTIKIVFDSNTSGACHP